MNFTSAVTVRHGTPRMRNSNITTRLAGASARHAVAPIFLWNRRWMMTKETFTSGGTHAQCNTTTQVPEQQDPLDWLVRHCSPSLVVSCPNLARRYGDQSDIAGKRAGRTVMDWCRLRQQVFDRQNNGGLTCTVQQLPSTATESHGRWRTIWSRFNSGLTTLSTIGKLSSTK